MNCSSSKGRAKTLGPVLQVADSNPRDILPSSLVGDCQVSMIVNQAAYHQTKKCKTSDTKHSSNIHFNPTCPARLYFFKTKNKSEETPPNFDSLKQQVPSKLASVLFSDAIPQPRAVVVMGCNTLSTFFAMLGSQWLLDVANQTKPFFDWLYEVPFVSSKIALVFNVCDQILVIDLLGLVGVDVVFH